MSFETGSAVRRQYADKGKQPARDGFRIRRESVENGVACLTSLDTAEAILRVLESMSFRADHMPAIRIEQKAAVR